MIDEITLDGHREEILEVETRPESLRPRRSRREVRSHLSTNGGPFEDQVEIHTVEFDWTGAIGCGQ